jgi:hypothetical protein
MPAVYHGTRFATLRAMRSTIPFLAILLLGVQDVRADIGSVYFQAHGGYAGGDTEELMPGGDDPSLGPALGLQAGARLFFFEGYLDHTEMTRTGSVSRAVLGLRGDLSILKLRLAVRAGVGAMNEEDGALSGVDVEGMQRVGACARLGGALDYELTQRLFFGVGMDGEAYALEGDRTGYDVMANARLSFELGI